MTDLGKIVTTYEGEYDPSKTYEIYTVVHYKQALWITKVDQVTGQAPSKESEYWKYMLEDGYSNTIVAYDTVVSKDGWIKSTEYPEYGWQNTFEVNGIISSSVPTVNFAYTEMISNNFAPMCKSGNNIITIFAQNKPTKDIILPIITASRFLDDEKLLQEGTRNSLQIQIDDTNATVQEYKRQLDQVDKNNFDALDASIKLNRKEVDAKAKENYDEVTGKITNLTTAVTNNRTIDKTNDESIVTNINANVLVKKDTTILKENFTETNEYKEFPYRAEIAFEGVTADYVPTVVLGYTEAISGDFAPISKADEGKVYIYSNYIPDQTLIIPSIICAKQITVQLIDTVSEEEV